ncbi:uncharacterized protein [Equus przewalskii]|uniref:Uncharacterized protein n=1 Tax=Equus przewalskii TaxID=9798 RepID=A0ABM4MQY5_EQUPR|nr:PREDICTED: uncharacterized protein LOC103558479 [Equus przewalskii]XP_008529721.1 PREDICTED: uncharacterized protein LOC103558479 [Equus przewalskii]XP_008529722.1 PREDICTED: uncharacterized protein LOC103558479 [Equus przewalskii]
MSGRPVGHSSTYSCLNHPNNVSFPARNPSWSHYPNVTGATSLKRPRTPSGSEVSSCSNPSEQSDNPRSPRLPVRRICMGQPYNSKCVETSHLATGCKVARKLACCGGPHCLLCTDRPARPSSPTFLDHLIKGINYLDRSTNAFYTNCTKSSLSLPRLAANYLQHAANSIRLDPEDHSCPRSYSHPYTSMATSDKSCTSTCLVPSAGDVNALQCVDDSVNTSCPRRLYSRKITPMLSQRPGIKLPELPLFGNGIFSLGRLPKFWEAIRSGWSAPEPISKPCSWW